MDHELEAVAFLSRPSAIDLRSRRVFAYSISRPSQHAIQINELTGHIQSNEDAHQLVDLVAIEFSDVLPPRWATRSLRNRIARAEYETATDPRALLPEDRIAAAWNDYLDTISAPEESHVTVRELHALHDSLYVSAQLSWTRGYQQIWTIPGIYSVGPDGKVTDGCRAIEAIRILYDLNRFPQNLQNSRTLASKGALLSDTIKNPSKPRPLNSQHAYVTVRVDASVNPVESAERQYLRVHGATAFDDAMQEIFNNLLPQ